MYGQRGIGMWGYAHCCFRSFASNVVTVMAYIVMAFASNVVTVMAYIVMAFASNVVTVGPFLKPPATPSAIHQTCCYCCAAWRSVAWHGVAVMWYVAHLDSSDRSSLFQNLISAIASRTYAHVCKAHVCTLVCKHAYAHLVHASMWTSARLATHRVRPQL